ncbi:alpha-ketoglutarate-dependent dioxygenase AlkB [Polaribacter sp. R2A056_3_33]|uniref:alpha-ketoglutarate-dependent dioxygenase AlkB n=1 Tax=Polaribacter sp. R2A056_3_33 TaxID=2745563 RepID=UPI001C4E8BA5|nr:alpha-ketoglutarate-dependent dioxygenase AlkB [Polaribacter sp. R2A056_3_33]QXP69311.1 alpha-ketoglutarate-dependent dioxygenase AlkB [Polaribacter sp. R2A056_3_33]
MQIDLFNNNKKNNKEVSLEAASSINGLKLYFDIISKEEEKLLLKNIDDNLWLNDLSRRVQHYGYKYDYRARKIDESTYLGELPAWLNLLALELYNKKAINFIPDQAIINEYEPGQGISPHIDCEPCFGDTIVSLSLGSSCVMNFSQNIKSKDKVSVLLEPRVLTIMTKESRYDWFHGIPSRKSDKYNDHVIKRGRRVSITFRKVVK